MNNDMNANKKSYECESLSFVQNLRFLFTIIKKRYIFVHAKNLRYNIYFFVHNKNNTI